MVLRENIRSGRKTENIEHGEECGGESLLKKKKGKKGGEYNYGKDIGQEVK